MFENEIEIGLEAYGEEGNPCVEDESFFLILLLLLLLCVGIFPIYQNMDVQPFRDVT
jgi:hypothetical protein